MNNSNRWCRLAGAALVAAGTLAVPPTARAEMTNWMTSAEAREHVRRVFKRERYATSIECRASAAGEMLVRFQTGRVAPVTKPFHKWQFVITPLGGLEAAIRAIPLRDRPELQYRIVSQDRAGNVGECAVMYR